jgi:hypothetical protein
MFIYPKQGQDAEQQRASHRKAMTACLEAREYTVK